MSCLVTDLLQEQLEEGNGYCLDLSLQKNELDLVRSLVHAQWIDNIKHYAPEHAEKFLKNGMEKYHELSHLLNHGEIWSKINRILPQNAIDLIRKTSLIKTLEDIYGEFEISDEENVRREEIYWRLVRPNQPPDIGPLHADEWFWKLGHGVTPPKVKRVKVWIALFCEPGLNGLCLVPNSHKKTWRYHGETRDGFVKPQIDEDISSLKIELVYTKPGEAIVFHDKLLHGGARNLSKNTRVSIEFTMFVKNK